MKEKLRVPWYYWPWWMLLLAAGLFVFYVLFTPVWMGIRLISWLAERRNLQHPTDSRATDYPIRSWRRRSS
jgi:hypothetical protein